MQVLILLCVYTVQSRWGWDAYILILLLFYQDFVHNKDGRVKRDLSTCLTGPGESG